MSRTEAITSAANPLLKSVRRAIVRGELTADGFAVAETFHLLEEALRSDCEVKIVLAAASVEAAVEKHVRRLAGIKVATAPDALFQSVAGTETSQGVIALVRAQPGSRAGRIAGPGERGHHRAGGGGLRRHRHDVPEGHGEPLQRQDTAGLGGD